jgi:hypothetical protein
VRLKKLVRSRLGAIGAAALTGVLALFLSATPAWACTVQVSGATTCIQPNAANRVVDWTIHNVESAANRPMTIVSATATISGTSYPVTGFAANVPPLGTTTAVTNVPTGVSGAAVGEGSQITLTVRATWPDNNKNHASATVTLMGTCPPPPTPPTSPNSGQNHGTTPPTEAGSSPVTAATAPLPPGSGVEAIESGPTTTAAPSSAELPFTGNATAIYALFGIALFVGGLMLVKSSRSELIDSVDER